MNGKSRTAACSCGYLSVECAAEPASVSLCHCLDCQRRTGSAFGIAAFYPRDAVRVRGESSRFARKTEEGFEFSFHFCPRCGSTVYWESSRKPGYVAVAAGAFADPAFPAPAKAHFAEHQHPWLRLSLH
jgi:hypothetical protein